MWIKTLFNTPPFKQITLSKFDEICPLAIPNQISTVSIHIPTLVKIHWCLQVIIRKRKMDGCTTDGRTDRHTDVQRETIIPCHYSVVGYKKYNPPSNSIYCLKLTKVVWMGMHCGNSTPLPKSPFTVLYSLVITVAIVVIFFFFLFFFFFFAVFLLLFFQRK